MLNNERLKSVRRALGFSMQEMAHALGMSGKNAADKVREYERNKRDMSMGQLTILGYLEQSAHTGAAGEMLGELLPKFIRFKDKRGNDAAMHTEYPRFYLFVDGNAEHAIYIDSDNVSEALFNEALAFLKG